MTPASPPPGDDATSLSDEPALVLLLARHFGDASLSDVSLRVGSHFFTAHKFVLACVSDVFRTMLYGSGWTESSETVLDLHESPDCEGAFEQFLRFFYTANVTLVPNNVVGILCLADKYNVEALRKLCLHFMLDNCKPQVEENVKNAISWYALSLALNLKDVASASMATIAWNAAGIMASAEWTSMELEFLRDMLSSSELVVPNELAVFDAVQRWLLDGQHSRCQDSAVVNSVLPLVRFSQMAVADLRSCEESRIATEGGEASRATLSNLLSKAYRFHALCSAGTSALRSAYKSADDASYTPRDYLDSVVDSVRMQNAVRFGMVVEVKTCSSPALDDRKDADWRLNYRRSDRAWTVQTQCLDARMSAAAEGRDCCTYRVTALIYDDADRILQVARTGAIPCRRGTSYMMEIGIDEPLNCRQMVVLLRPCIY